MAAGGGGATDQPTEAGIQVGGGRGRALDGGLEGRCWPLPQLPSHAWPTPSHTVYCYACDPHTHRSLLMPAFTQQPSLALSLPALPPGAFLSPFPHSQVLPAQARRHLVGAQLVRCQPAPPIRLLTLGHARRSGRRRLVCPGANPRRPSSPALQEDPP
eukprot:scaffold19885_cov141-Isochrysis_galbana.AAC.3